MSAQPQSFLGAAANDTDALETKEWLDALSAVIGEEGGDRAHFLLETLIDHARQAGIDVPFSATTAYVNTIPADQEERFPGNIDMEERLRAFMRWNAMAMVVRANRLHPEDGGDLGGHISTFASSATLLGHAASTTSGTATTDEHGGDLVFFQGHSAPGVYARAFLEGRISEEQLDNFRQEVDGKGLSSYPHPWLMPDFWQFPTVSMGLGPIMAIYQARFMKYLEARGFIADAKQKVWGFLGDGEMDEPESLGAIALAAREKLDNLIFVINCNLQRLDGPVRGNGKIIQELEGVFRGAGWNVIKVIWGCRYWDPLLARDKQELLRKVMMETHRRRIPDLQGQRRRLRARALLRQAPRTAGDGQGPFRRGNLEPEPRRPRPAQGLRGLPPGGEHQGPADRHPGQDHQGLRHGQDRRRQEHRAPDQEAAGRGHQGLPRPLRHPGHGRRAGEAAVLQAGRRHARDAVPARAPPGAGRLPAEAPSAGGRGAEGARAGDLPGRAGSDGRGPRDLHHHGLRADPHAAGQGQGTGPAHRADRRGRGPYLRHGRPVPPDRHLHPRGPALRAGGQGPGDVLPRGQGRPDPAGRHQRSGRHVQLDRRGDLVHDPQPADAAVLHLLLDVRLPAHRRPGLGRRRHAARAAS